MDYDVVITDPKIFDGTGKLAFKDSIWIKGEKIAALGDAKGDAVREIDGSNLVACPGFIDIHQHGDVTILQYPLAENFVMQGITTFVGGMCGLSLAPVKDYMPLGIMSAGVVGSWWNEVEPHSFGPPQFLSLEKYGDILEKRLGFTIDWRTFGDFLSKVERAGISANYVPFVGHHTLRVATMGMDFKRRSKPSEIEDMKKHVDEAMRSGAFGLGTGFDGGPGDFGSTEEVTELAKVAQKYGGLYFSHLRNTDNNYPSINPEEWGYGICHNMLPEEMPVSKYYGLLEIIEICRKAKIPGQIGHIMPAYVIHQYYPEYLQEAAAKATLDVIDKAREEGLDITFDVMPDHDLHGVMLSKPSLIGLFSKWLRLCGSKKGLVENMKLPDFRDRLRKEIMGGKFKFLMIHPKTDPYWMDRVTIVSYKNKSYEGKSIGQIAREKNANPIDTIFDTIIEDPDALITCTDPRWTETTVRVFIQHPAAMIGSDLVVVPFGETKIEGGGGIAAGEPGLATYAFYPRYIRRFAREKTILSLEEAVKKATYLPAQKLGLKDRGVISPSAYADILLFDFERIGDKGTWWNPRQIPEGVEYVLVNGKIVYEKNNHTGLRSGKVLRHK